MAHSGLIQNAREFCGRPLRHLLEPFLVITQIEPHTTKVHAPSPNVCCAHLHLMVGDTCFTVTFRMRCSRSVTELQATLDAWLAACTMTRPHHGCRDPGAPHAAGRPGRPGRVTGGGATGSIVEKFITTEVSGAHQLNTSYHRISPEKPNRLA